MGPCLRFGPRSLEISFTGKKVTHFGGVYLLHLFFKRIKLKSLLSKKVFFAERNNHYTISEVILALVYPIALGFGRIETTYLLRHNRIFQYLTGLPTCSNPQTLRRFLLRMAPLSLPRLRRLHDKLLSTMMLKLSPPTRMIFDMDSTVLVLYGKKVIIRADKGFFDHKTVEYLESKNARFAIVARLTPPIKRTLAGLSYHRYASGLETAEFMHPIKAGYKEHRFVVV